MFIDLPRPSPLSTLRLTFIAYAHGDGEQAVQQLRDRLPPWVEPWVDDARWPGQAVTVAITKAMSGSDLVLCVMTPRSVQEEHWCQREIRRAEVIGLPVIGLQFHPGADAPIQMDLHVFSRPSWAWSSGRSRCGAGPRRPLDQ
jgi:hypothetical protein